jgi:hypothetical protein
MLQQVLLFELQNDLETKAGRANIIQGRIIFSCSVA